MKKLFVAAIAAASFFTAPAFAADMPVKAAPAPIFSWNGFYVGAYGGAAWGSKVNSSDPCVANVGGNFAQGTCYQVTGGGFSNNGALFYSPASYNLGSSAIGGSSHV